MSTMICNLSKRIDIPCLNQVELSRPFYWVRDGLGDFARMWPWSLTLGAIFAVLGFYMVHESWGRPELAMTLTTGFLLVAPFLAMGFYDLSLRKEREEQLGEPLKRFAGVKRNLGSIGMFAILMAFIFSIWERISAVLFALYVADGDFSKVGFGSLLSGDNLQFMIVYGVVGAALALLVFCLGVVSLPMMMDQPVDIVTACMTSLWTVWENKLVMLIWAAIIVGLTALGLMTSFVGIAIVFPVLGHATWHAYRELVGS